MNWERPSDHNLTWFLDEHLCPVAIGPLSQSLYSYMFQGYRKAQRERGREQPAVLRIMFVRGYFYFHVRPGSPHAEHGKEAAHLSPSMWEREWLPEIRANLGRLDAYPLPSLADDQLSAVLQDGLKTLARHWEIQHSLDYGAVKVAQAATRTREDHLFWIEGQTTDALRRICAEFGQRMVAAGILADPAEISLVTAPELLRFGYGIAQPHLRAELSARRAEHEANLQHRPAPWVGAPPPMGSIPHWSDQ